MITGQGVMETTDAGARRESNAGRGRFDLLPYEAMEALAKWYEDGSVKYGDRNWEDGLSVKDCINRMIRHSLKAGNGWSDEDHLAAVMWNAAAAITMIQRRPDLNDHIFKEAIDEVAASTSKDVYDEIISIDRGIDLITIYEDKYGDIPSEFDTVNSKANWIKNNVFTNNHIFKEVDEEAKYDEESNKQYISSFNLIDLYERKYGLVPSEYPTVESKVKWLRTHITMTPTNIKEVDENWISSTK